MSGRPREFEREKALEKAMEVFWDRGFEGTGMSELVERTGVAKQSLYNTFGNKKALYHAALRHYAGTRHQALIGILREPGPAFEKIECVLRMWQEKAQSSDCSGCMIVNSAAESSPQDSELGIWLADRIQEAEAAFLQVLARAQEEGDLHKDLDSRQLARLLVSTGQGLSVLGKLPLPSHFAGDVVEMMLLAMRSLKTEVKG